MLLSHLSFILNSLSLLTGSPCTHTQLFPCYPWFPGCPRLFLVCIIFFSNLPKPSDPVEKPFFPIVIFHGNIHLDFCFSFSDDTSSASFAGLSLLVFVCFSLWPFTFLELEPQRRWQPDACSQSWFFYLEMQTFQTGHFPKVPKPFGGLGSHLPSCI